jgi:hypothetical protein
MTSLLDIGPLTEEVEIRGTKVTVQGITAGHLFQLFAEFPDMRKLLDGSDDPMSLMALAPDLIAKIIAIATGSPNDKEVEARAKTLGAAEQLAVVAAAQRLSFPQGLGPFLEQLNRMMGSAIMPAIPSVLDAKPSTLSSIKSCALSSASLQTDTPAMARGPAPRVN